VSYQVPVRGVGTSKSNYPRIHHWGFALKWHRDRGEARREGERKGIWGLLSHLTWEGSTPGDVGGRRIVVFYSGS